MSEERLSGAARPGSRERPGWFMRLVYRLRLWHNVAAVYDARERREKLRRMTVAAANACATMGVSLSAAATAAVKAAQEFERAFAQLGAVVNSVPANEPRGDKPRIDETEQPSDLFSISDPEGEE